MNISEIITQMAKEGHKAKDIAQVAGLTPNSMLMCARLSRADGTYRRLPSGNVRR